LRGTYAGRPVTREFVVNLPASEPKHDVLATLWARTRIDTLAHEPDAREEITKLGLYFRIMTPYTSFVAVEETIVTDGGKPRRVDVPVEMPEGVSYDGVFGKQSESPVNAVAMPYSAAGGVIGGIVGGVPATRQMVMVAPAEPAAKAERAGQKLDPGLLKATGEVLVIVYLKDAADPVLARLKALGLEMTRKPGASKFVIGRIDASKLKKLSELDAVKYVTRAH
jgi:Ca-activated chloride channel family protein